MKLFQKFCSILTIFLMGTLFITSTNAQNLAMQYGNVVPGQDEDEIDKEDEVCYNLNFAFQNDFWDYYYPFDCYGDLTTASNVADCMDYQVYYSDVVSNFWVGDFHPDPGPTPSPEPYGHLWFYSANSPSQDISDDFVHDHCTALGTQTSSNRFSFIWTCTNGGRYWTDAYGGHDDIAGITYPASPQPTTTPYNTNTKYGWFNPVNTNYGMPFAWTGRLDMNLDGYNCNEGSFCYIGFEGPSPFMLGDNPGNPLNTAPYNFIYAFYYKALGYDDAQWYYEHQTVHTSLDYAAYLCYGTYTFSSTPYYQGYWVHVVTEEEDRGWFLVHMRVLGNSNLLV